MGDVLPAETPQPRKALSSMDARKKISCCRVASLAFALTVLAVLCSCAPSQSASVGSGEAAEDAIVEAAWSFDGDCSACHADEAASIGESACEASAHASMTCIDCHTDEDALAAAHSDATSASKMLTKLKQTEVENSLCLSCHEGTLENLVSATEGIASVTDSKGTAVNPHSVLSSEQHAGILCGDCHSMHSDKGIEESAHDECISCHHADVFQCYTCHD